jgi:hypothetical protein
VASGQRGGPRVFRFRLSPSTVGRKASTVGRKAKGACGCHFLATNRTNERGRVVNHMRRATRQLATLGQGRQRRRLLQQLYKLKQ